MRLKGILITAVVLLSAVFAAVNWPALFAVQPVNLLFTTIEIPVGITLLLVALALSLLFFLVSLFDRATQLRQITQQERQIAQLQARLDKRRLEELAELAGTVTTGLSGVGQQVRDENSRLEANLREDLGALEERMSARLKELQERVLLVRNELAADIAASEETLRRSALPAANEPE
jgi:uncharacterized integral membrane protein